MRRRDRQSEMVVALIVAIAMVFALIFAIVLSLGNEGDETAEASPAPDSQPTIDSTVEATPESDDTEESASTTPTRVIITSAGTASIQASEVILATEAVEEATAAITDEASAPASPTQAENETTEVAIVATASNTATLTASPTEAASASDTPRPTRTRVNWQDLQTQVAQQAASNQPPASPTPTASNTPTATLTSSATPSLTVTLTATLSPSATLTWTASRTPTLTVTPSRTASPTATATATPSLTPSTTPTLTTVALVQTQAPTRTAIPLAFLRTQAAAGTVTQLAVLASPTPIPCTPRSDWDIYVIDVGDTFYSIARRYNLSMEALAAANCIPNLSLIYAGQPLRVPPGGDRAVQGPDAGVEFCNTSDAILTAPSPGAALTGMVILRGVAQGTNFRRYILDWRPDDPAVDYQSFAEVFTAATAEGELGQFNSDAFPPGLYWFRLRVLETNDFIIGQCAIRVRFR